MKKISSLLIILSGILWGLMGVFSNALNSIGFTSIQGSAIRIILCALMLTAINFKYLKIEFKDIWKFALIGIFSILTMSTTYFESIRRSSLTLASVLLYTAPVMVMVMSAVFYKEKITLKKLMCLIGAVAGIIMISGIDSTVNLSRAGLVYGLLSAFSYALYSIIGKLILKKYKSVTVSTYAFIFASLGALTICDIPEIVKTASTSPDILYTLAVMAGCALVTAAIPYTLYTLSLSYTNAGTASVLACVEPLTATVIGIAFYGDKLGIISFIGIILIFMAVGFLSFSNNTK
jgi:drug/metabolite transporter (DMT)-like permease